MNALAQLCLEAYYTLRAYKMKGCLTDGTSFYYYKFCIEDHKKLLFLRWKNMNIKNLCIPI